MMNTDENCDVVRCEWLTKDPEYIRYHDEEWGNPEYNSIRLLEMLCLEGQQAGLSWLTILKKRDNYRKLFFNFDPHIVARLKQKEISNYINNPGIVRHNGKIEAIINNAKCFIKMEEMGEDFSHFIWNFVNNEPIVNNWNNSKDVPTESEESISLSIALKKKGFKYVGSTICYAFMQACGLVNDHILSCVCRKK
ncbi:DNA-3-methyladenine glycosylase 1-like [Pectinophora gossypiella]|uniref:DNA-3-methyladenine glycosylase 1-like n=1 Tax=Pectinophora gossypiella TaxID=13191 RepID=UPI00214E7B93|nr:DNA-3-methyladenine glycosylase 1-like [Pectinophora gossypiella]